MAWIIQLVGKKEAVAAELAKKFAEIDPGDQVLGKASENLAVLALGTLHQGTAVTLTAIHETYGRVSFEIEPMADFLE